MIRSMTGFGSAEGSVGGFRVSVEIRSVNHRFFTPSIKLPSELGRWESEVREALRRSVNRGHVTLTARFVTAALDGDGDGVIERSRIDEAKFAQYVQQLRELQRRHNLGDALEIGSILRLPEVITSDVGADRSGTAPELVTVVERALVAFGEMRAAEGARMVEYVRHRLGVIESAVDRIGERAPARLLEHRDRLREAVRELADGVALDEQRLAQEVALIADRLDVGEELARFRSHLTAFGDTLREPPPDGVGKRLGFLLQELLRETNTTGSKANDSTVLEDVLLIKEELERIREQVENLE
jgi:uncharacterized protein (TIGR00255 family)